MANKKLYRADNTYMISQDSTDNPKLGAKMLNDGRESIFMDIYLGMMPARRANGNEYMKKIRRREFLKLYLWAAPRTPTERLQNKATLELAKKLRFEKSQEILNQIEGYSLKVDRDINFLEYFQAYINSYKKKDIRVVQLALRRFMEFLMETPRYRTYADYLRPDCVSREMIRDFTDFLKERCRGEGAKTAFGRFRKVVRYAIEQEVMVKDPCSGISIRVDDNQIKKDVLSMDEIVLLMQTHCPGENINIRNAFVLSLYTGMRFCDVRDLTFENVDYGNRLLRYDQNKTRGHSSNSGVVIPLNDGLLKLIRQHTEAEDRKNKIFSLPSHTMCLKALRRWVKQAVIDNHVTWHCARHSFALNILNNGANIKTVASLLGHSGIKTTEKYVRAVDALKQAAIDSLPGLRINQ